MEERIKVYLTVNHAKEFLDPIGGFDRAEPVSLLDVKGVHISAPAGEVLGILEEEYLFFAGRGDEYKDRARCERQELLREARAQKGEENALALRDAHIKGLEGWAEDVGPGEYSMRQVVQRMPPCPTGKPPGVTPTFAWIGGLAEKGLRVLHYEVRAVRTAGSAENRIEVKHAKALREVGPSPREMYP